MPAIQTHFAFAKFEALSPKKAYREAALLGSQGPDPFFFYGMLPWRKRKNSKEVNAYGTELHHSEISSLYSAMMKYANEHKERKELLLSFIEGLMLHYVLDRNCHPYLFSITGYELEGEPLKKKKYYASLHAKIEHAIDKIYGREQGTFEEVPSYCLELVNDEELMEISRMWFEANKVSVNNPNIAEDTFFLSIKDFNAAYKFINKPYKLKRNFIGVFMGKTSMAYSISYPRGLDKVYPKADFMNVKKRYWLDPVTGEKRKETFHMLMANAKKEYLEYVVPMMDKARAGEDVTETLHLFYDGINHDGCKEGKIKTYMSPIYPYKG